MMGRSAYYDEESCAHRKTSRWRWPFCKKTETSAYYTCCVGMVAIAAVLTIIGNVANCDDHDSCLGLKWTRVIGIVCLVPPSYGVVYVVWGFLFDDDALARARDDFLCCC